jgi:hypothetical protein
VIVESTAQWEQACVHPFFFLFRRILVAHLQ